MSLSPVFKLIDAEGLHYFCNTDRCGGSFFMYQEGEGWMCNACKTRPLIRPGATFHAARTDEPEVETTNTVPVTFDPQ